ncbi:MAG: HAD-IIIA family hydrolase [Candidatus Tectomicrobia bacterium]|nr:HAD-IIIA family hydrolase [Candidatus Tectomicrobia bacterium]
MDVDGVLTDGQITFDSRGNEFKSFDVKDGQGIALAHQAGLKTAILTGRSSSIVSRRAEELGIKLVFQNVRKKIEVYEQILREQRLKDEEVAYIADDLNDLPLLSRVGLPIAVADAALEVKSRAVLVTKTCGGRGAVREAIESILRAQGKWETIVKHALGE